MVAYKTPPAQWQVVHWPPLLLQESISGLVYAHIAHRHSHSKRDTVGLRHRITLTRQETEHSGKNRDQFERCKKAEILCIWYCVKSNPLFIKSLFVTMSLKSQSIWKKFQSFSSVGGSEMLLYVYIHVSLSCQTTLTGFGWNLLDSRKLFLSSSDFWALAKKYPTLWLDWQLSSPFYRTARLQGLPCIAVVLYYLIFVFLQLLCFCVSVFCTTVFLYHSIDIFQNLYIV